MSKIVVVGSLNMDLVIQTDRMPRMGETIIGRDFANIPGGKGANQAVAIGRLGGDVSMIGCVGNDSFGTELVENLKRNNARTENITVTDKAGTGLAMIIVNNGDNCIILSSGANYEITPEDILKLENVISVADVVVTQLEIPIEVVRLTLQLAKKHKKFTILNPAPACPLDDGILSHVDVILPNETEAEILTGIPVLSEEDAIRAAKHFQDKGIPYCIVTLGSKGLVYSDAEGQIRLPAFPAEVVDTTAAGDSFVGALAVKVAQKVPLREALSFCNAVSALTVTKKGAQESLPTLADVKEYLKDLNPQNTNDEQMVAAAPL